MNILHRGEVPTHARDDAVAEQSDTAQLTVKERVEALPLILNPKRVLYERAFALAPSSQGPQYTDHITDPVALKQLAAEIWDEMLSGNRETLEQMSQTTPW
jgi:hypothetical protein